MHRSLSTPIHHVAIKQTTHDVIRARLLEEKQNRARVVGTISFSLSVIYAQSHEFWVCGVECAMEGRVGLGFT